MKKYGWQIAVSLVVILSFLINQYVVSYVVPLQEQTFVISPVSMLNRYVVRPVFWLGAGMLLGWLLLKMFSPRRKHFGRACFFTGCFLVFAYIIFLVLILCGSQTLWYRADLNISLWMNENTPVFAVPGLLIGIGRKNRIDNHKSS